MLDLATLVAPLTPEEFRRDHWPHTPLWHPSGPQRVAALAGIPELESGEAVLEKAAPVTVFRPDGTGAAVANGKAALPLYRLGLTCYIGARHIPGLRATVDRVTRELGLPAAAISGEVFCSTGTSGVKMHSDFDVNFAVLLRGRKRWQIAPNRHIRNQTGMCVPSTRELTDRRQLELADEVPFPAGMPADATTIEVEAGGLVFLPRGWWHETQSEGECLQVNLVLKKPFWMGVLTRAIETRLGSDPGWRGFAFDVLGPPERREAAIAELAALLPTLPALLGDLVSQGDPLALARRILEEAELKSPEQPP